MKILLLESSSPIFGCSDALWSQVSWNFLNPSVMSQLKIYEVKLLVQSMMWKLAFWVFECDLQQLKPSQMVLGGWISEFNIPTHRIHCLAVVDMYNFLKAIIGTFIPRWYHMIFIFILLDLLNKIKKYPNQETGIWIYRTFSDWSRADHVNPHSDWHL